MTRKRKSQPSQSREGQLPLKAIREHLQLTQVEFAVALGVDPSTISRCERGLSEIEFTLLQVKRLCKLTGKSLDELPDYLGRKHRELALANGFSENLEN